MRYLALLADPAQHQITRAAWTVATEAHDLAWAGWQPASVVAVENEPPAEWYRSTPVTRSATELAWRSSMEQRARAALGETDLVSLITRAPDTRHHQRYTPPPGLTTAAFSALAHRDELHREQALGRVGWFFVAGQIQIGPDIIPCCFPLFERRVKFAQVNGTFYPQWQGALRRNALLRRRGTDQEVDPIDDFLRRGAGTENPSSAAAEVAQLLQHYGVTITALTDGTGNPAALVGSATTTLVPGAGFYLAPSVELASTNDLGAWSKRIISHTAFSELYRTTDTRLHPVEDQTSVIRSALPLNGRQREAIDRLDTETVVAVSGPPGTGKTHTIVAAACDAVARGLSVLVATKTDFAAESTCELLEQYPTPPHIRFGRAEHRRQVADRLSAGSTSGIRDDQLEALVQANDAAWEHLAKVKHFVDAALVRKQQFERARHNPNLQLASAAPELLQPGFSHNQLARTLAEVDSASGRRKRRAVDKLRKLIGGAENATLDIMKLAIDGARAELAIQTALDQAQGAGLDDLWAQLDRAETDARATQSILDIARRSRPSPGALASIATLATALRASTEDGDLQRGIEVNTAFLHHLPFWVGTLDEIESTLPANPGMFDVVLFDEASQIDQLSAVPALCRAKRAFIVGDPQQLRHSSAITREQIDAARLHAQLAPGDDAALLDVAANSLFDVAAASTPITWLDEHFRSNPHLIQFSSQRWYGGQLRLMTQHPRNERLDTIHTYQVPGQRQSAVNATEIEAIIGRLRHYATADSDVGSIGVITPFVEQAEALEDAIVTSFDYDTIRRLKLRVGTVRGVQGTERDIILVSLVLDERDYATALPMVEDRHLFNVMTTRARSQLQLFHSFDAATLPPGLLADWFHYEANPPGITGPKGQVSRWTEELAEALRLAGYRVITGYPVAGWNLDLVVGEGSAAFGVETTVHSNGVAAHIERHLTLRRAGWHLVSAFESNWLLQSQDAAVELAAVSARRASTLA